MSTYLQLVQGLHQELGISGTSPSTVSGQTGEIARLVKYIADATEAVDNLHLDWNYLWGEKEWTLTTGSSGRVYTLADLSLTGLLTYWKRDGAIYDPDTDDYWHLDFVEWRAWRTLYRLGTKLSEPPVAWTQRPDKAVEFNSNPSEAKLVRFEYGKARTRLAADGDIPASPAHLHRIYVLRAKVMYAEYESAPEIMETALSEYQGYLNRLEAESLPNREHQSAAELSIPLVVETI